MFYQSINDKLDMVKSVLDVQTTLIFVLMSLFATWLLIRKPLGLPPGPRWRSPILGNLRSFVREKDIRITLKEFRNKYGDIYSLYFGRKLVVVVSGLSAISEAFFESQMFCDRPDSVAKKRSKGQGILNSNGKQWKRNRKFVSDFLHSINVGTMSIESKIQQEVTRLLKRITTRASNQSVDLRDALSASVINITCSVAFGKSYEHEDLEFKLFLELSDEILEARGSTGLLNFLPCLRYMPTEMCDLKDYDRAFVKFDNFLDARIQDCKSTNAEYCVDYCLDSITAAYLQEMKNSKTPSAQKKKFSEFDLRVTIADIFACSTETITTTLRWAILYLINFPETQTRIYTEIVELVGKDCYPTIDNLQQLTYTEAFMMETQRLSHMMILGLPRSVAHDVMFRNFIIPKGSMLFPDITSVHMDAELWENPTDFKPERFISATGKVIHPEGFIPFMRGKRNCLGEQWAKMELFIMFASLVQKFEFLPPDAEPIDIDSLDGVFGIAHAPKPYNVVVKLREYL